MTSCSEDISREKTPTGTPQPLPPTIVETVPPIGSEQGWEGFPITARMLDRGDAGEMLLALVEFLELLPAIGQQLVDPAERGLDALVRHLEDLLLGLLDDLVDVVRGLRHRHRPRTVDTTGWSP